MYPILDAIIGALLYAVTGYLKNCAKDPFSLVKFGQTLFVGVFVGLIMYSLNANFEVGLNIAVSLGLVALAENLSKAIIRWLRK